jgi:hypothetical protein
MVSALVSRSQLRQFDHARLIIANAFAARSQDSASCTLSLIGRNCEKFPGQ